ncbi:MAG: glucose-6-phosphate isomerase [Varibaculum sp.]|nr:glucose-6-phosphate isomerase [Varibaculum sp.]
MNPTETVAWRKLAELAKTYKPDMRAAFDTDPGRAEHYTFEAADLRIDLSKNLVDEEIVNWLLQLVEQTGLAELREQMFNGAHINTSEDRAVLHTALRLPVGSELVVDGQDVVADVHTELAKMYRLVEQVRSGEWVGVTGQRIETVVNIGIGGSDLGPVMAYEALKPYRQEGLECRFISNVDPSDLREKTADLDPETTLFIVSSKTFTTLETITNARGARSWLLRELVSAGAIADTDQGRAAAVAKHFMAVSTNLEKVAEFGINTDNVVGFWNWVGGRYSLDSAIGTSLAIAIGQERFTEFLSGYHAIDDYFRNTHDAENAVTWMGMINVWYRNFLGYATHAVVPYDQYLHRLPAFLQQLTMESNGKRVRADGSEVDYPTGEVFFGEPGTNGQHAFFQLIHQGTSPIPTDFIAFANPVWPIKDGDTDQHELLLANFMAQSRALAFGKTADEVRAEGTPEAIVPARVFTGNRPSTSIMGPELSPKVLGELIALYEHVTFVEGALWGINSFDQWGVELGKVLALQLIPAIAGDETVIAEQDSSTRGMIYYYRDHRR